MAKYISQNLLVFFDEIFKFHSGRKGTIIIKEFVFHVFTTYSYKKP